MVELQDVTKETILLRNSLVTERICAPKHKDRMDTEALPESLHALPHHVPEIEIA